MNPVRRIEGEMGENLYHRLGDVPNIQLTWSCIRELISQQLFGTDYVAVPYIESAIYFNQLFVFIKKRSFCSNLGLRPPNYKIVGNLDYLVNRNVSTWAPQFDFSAWDIADGQKMNKEFKWRILSAERGLQKSIELIVVEPHARSAAPPIPETLTIHTNLVEDLKDVRKVYVITDVVFASFLKMTVKIGNVQKSITYVQDTPIGFKYRKYRLNSDGLFCSEVPIVLHNSHSDFYWLKPLPQPVPPMPSWDFLGRRRYASGSEGKRLKSILTIPTPETPRRSAVTDALLTEASDLDRIDGLPANDAMVNDREVIDVDNNQVLEDDHWGHVINRRRSL